MKALLLLLAVACSAQSVKWHEVTSSLTGTLPAAVGYTWINYDSVSHQTFMYQAFPGSLTTIYGTDTYSYKSSNTTFTHINGYGNLDNDGACAEPDGPTIPKPLHATAITIDVERSILVRFSGACQGAFPSPNYMWRLGLNSDPSADAWTRGTAPAHVCLQDNNQSMTAVTAIGYYWFGYDGAAGSHDTCLYCPLLGNPGGTLTATQIAAGCTEGDNWIELDSTGQPASPLAINPRLIPYGSDVYILLEQGTFSIYKYNIPTQTFTHLCLSCPDPGGGPDQIAAAYIGHGKILFHQVAGTAGDWVYDIAGDTLSSIGPGGPLQAGSAAYAMDYDSSTGKLIAWSMSGTDFHLWEGQVIFGSSVSDGVSLSGGLKIQ